MLDLARLDSDDVLPFQPAATNDLTSILHAEARPYYGMRLAVIEGNDGSILRHQHTIRLVV